MGGLDPAAPRIGPIHTADPEDPLIPARQRRPLEDGERDFFMCTQITSAVFCSVCLCPLSATRLTAYYTGCMDPEKISWGTGLHCIERNTDVRSRYHVADENLAGYSQKNLDWMTCMISLVSGSLMSVVGTTLICPVSR